MRRCLPLLLGITLTGCAGLQVHNDDPTPTKVAKFTARAWTAFTSFGFSELIYWCARGTNYYSWDRAEWARLTPQERLNICMAPTQYSRTHSAPVQYSRTHTAPDWDGAAAGRRSGRDAARNERKKEMEKIGRRLEAEHGLGSVSGPGFERAAEQVQQFQRNIMKQQQMQQMQQMQRNIMKQQQMQPMQRNIMKQQQMQQMQPRRQQEHYRKR